MPDGAPPAEPGHEDDSEQRRQQLFNFGHSQWGCNNWNWNVTKQDLDFVDFENGKYTAGVAAFVSVAVKSHSIHRENVGYATSSAATKGLAIYMSRRCAVTNALRETLLSFGGGVAAQLVLVLEASRAARPAAPEAAPGAHQCPPDPVGGVAEPGSSGINTPRGSVDTNGATPNTQPAPPAPAAKNVTFAPPPPPAAAKAHTMPAGGRAAVHRGHHNVSYVLQPMMGGVPVPPMFAPPPPPRYAPPHVHALTNYGEYPAGPWHYNFDNYDRHHGNVNLNFNVPPKNLVVNNRPGSVECRSSWGAPPGAAGAEGDPAQCGPPPQHQGCWVKPAVFYDGFWTEQKMKKWVAEQVEKHIPENPSQKPPTPNNGQPDSSDSK